MQIKQDSFTHAYACAGHVPETVYLPKETNEIAHLLKLAVRDEKKVLILGNNTQSSTAIGLEPYHWVISTKDMDGILEYDVNDFTITAQAGMRLAELRKVARQNNQYLPLDPVCEDTLTLGGLVAQNMSGSLRYRYGSVRDQLLGMKYVLGDGTVARSGGKTVKNVAGYDVFKLFIGSFGTLGAISEVTWKLSPIPTNNVYLAFQTSDKRIAQQWLRKLTSSQISITALDVLNNSYINHLSADGAQLINNHKWHIWVRIEGEDNYLADITNSLKNEISQTTEASFQQLPDSAWQAIHKPVDAKKYLIMKVSISRDTVLESMDSILHWGSEQKMELNCKAHAGSGIIFVNMPISGDLKKPTDLIDDFRYRIEGFGGNAVVVSLPELEYADVNIWGTIPPGFDVMETIKKQFDPFNVLARGRFIGGL